jgi:hypothetical protein
MRRTLNGEEPALVLVDQLPLFFGLERRCVAVDGDHLARIVPLCIIKKENNSLNLNK